ncbi:hypothetical protein OUZ56_007282 [Daphnia magna]|uniref:Uncharacterized protein n=1 Tax=Daphnia magna TaxID=35525 RepID=A0ABQ9YY51_9CRUS|nr:hypothetical protein OUZ56_007282 [Daphnia magna]
MASEQWNLALVRSCINRLVAIGIESPIKDSTVIGFGAKNCTLEYPRRSLEILLEMLIGSGSIPSY